MKNTSDLTDLQRNFSIFWQKSAQNGGIFRFFSEFSAVLDWSIIPLRGDSDPSNPKAPALPSWKIYQQKPPSRRLLKAWFEGHPNRVVGIITGRVSHLAVLDIDNPQRAQDFMCQCPDLAQTLTVRSGNRQLPHYYFYVPDELTVPARHADGVDLRSDGQYVVAFGSVINGQCWQLMNDLPPRPLNKDDLARLLAFIGSSSVPQKSNSAKPPLSSIQPLSHIVDTTDEALVKRYRQSAYQIGRNNALFATACYARDHDWSEADVCRALIQPHIAQPPPPKHEPETALQRQAEALATINSVFNRPARADRPMAFAPQLPNALREKLLQLKLDNVARVLDGLLMVGYKAGQKFTASQAYQALGQLGIGRNTVYAALKAVVDAGRSLTGQAAPPSPPHPLFPDANAAMRYADVTKLMRFGRVAKPGKIAGRPEHHHEMPSIEVLCEALEVKAQGGDTLQVADLKSPTAYRSALHTALIRRRPGQYSRRWQGGRLGVSEESCRRYERQAGVVAQPIFYTHSVDWRTVDSVIPDEPMPGGFIEDEQGKRYPALRLLAKKLLALRHVLTYKQQDANHYHLPSPTSKVSDSEVFAPLDNSQKSPSRRFLQQPTFSKVSESEVFAPLDNSQKSPSRRFLQQPTFSKVSESEVFAPLDNSQKSPSRRFLQQQSLISDSHSGQSSPPSSDVGAAEACADRLYDALRRLNPKKSITRKAALALTQEFGIRLVDRAVRMLIRREDLSNPGGFVQVWLRGERLAAGLSTSDAIPTSPPKYPSSESTPTLSRDEWLKKLFGS